MFFDWKDEYEIGIPEIDAQHQKLFMMVKVLHGYVESQGGHLVMRNFLKELIKYTETHFADEEAYIEKVGLPASFIAQEKNEHQDLMVQVRKIKQDHEKKHQVFTPELIRLLVDWLANHIVRTDSQIAKLVAKTKG